MRIVVIGGSGLIGGKLVKNLRQGGHEAVPASPSSGVNPKLRATSARAALRSSSVVRSSFNLGFSVALNFAASATANLPLSKASRSPLAVR